MGLEIFYIISLIIDLIIINVFFFRKEHDNKRLLITLKRLIISVTIMVSSGVLALFVPIEEVALFFQVLNYAGMDVMLICQMRFLENYVVNVRSTRVTKTILNTYCLLTCISLLANPIFHHVVKCRRVHVNGMTVNSFITLSPWFELHRFFSYLMTLLVFITIVSGVYLSVRLYRKKYLYVLFVMILTIILDVVCTALDFSNDFSLYGYCAQAFFFTYFSLYYKPKDIIYKTLTYMIDDSNMGVVCFDPEDKCIYINDGALMLDENCKSQECIKKKYLKLLGADSFKETEDKNWSHEFTVNGDIMYYNISFAKLYDEKSDYIGCHFTIRDNTDDVNRYKQERYRATHDSLTGLHNIEYFYDKVMDVINSETDKRYYVVCTDIKDFKLINDLFGYEKGNEILKCFAKRLKDTLPEGSAVARLVSDKFTFLIPKEMFEESYLIGCIEDVQGLITSTEFRIHIHAGIYEVKPNDNDVSIMCDKANLAIKRVKNSYEIVTSYYDDTLMNKVIHDKYLINEFDNALINKQFVIYLQPQVNTDGAVLGAEALVRWIHPENGMISPGDFIPLFEDSGLIHRLDMYVWEQAAVRLREWKEKGREDLYISVNISTKDFYYLDLYRFFTGLVEKYDIYPGNLKLEITETAFMQDMEKQMELLTQLQNYGFHVEIDDFGSGYSSLNMLKNITADVLKIDMGFLREINDHERAKIILGMIIDLAKRLDMTVITEGVEHKAQVDYLIQIGCEMFQGFYFARPIDIAEFEKRYIMPM